MSRQQIAFTVVIDALVFGLLYAATVLDFAPARTVFGIVMWSIVVILLLGGFIVSTDEVKKWPPRPSAFVLWHYATSVVLIIWMTYGKMPELAGFYTLAFAITESKRVAA